MVCAALFYTHQGLIICLIDVKSSCIAGHIKLGLGTRLRAKPARSLSLRSYNIVPSQLTTRSEGLLYCNVLGLHIVDIYEVMKSEQTKSERALKYWTCI